ncbi:hypothetical protein [Maribellus maritimus]|uniref:hypothetical protein n=1 Tax=Maribellus maritimus TaxID=2870838 RepID=UPI001EEA94A3|nr:hypothetical protein [Maribellus maritimus]MCG6190965.1 hypothetical protein [Maribellus maritimus]
MTHTEGTERIIIQEVSEKGMTLNVNGEIRTIHNQLAELKELVKNQNVSNVTYENKVYNIEHINEANFGVVTSNKVFNGVLTRDLILLLKDKKKPQSFLSGLPEEDKDNWESIRMHLRDAQEILVESFVWIIGWEMRRLFSIGNDKEKRIETKIDEYLNHCFSTYRISLQLINFLFISQLWDEKSSNPAINSKNDEISNFFNASRDLKLSELRNLFQSLIKVYKTNKLEFPLKNEELGDVDEFLNPESKFNLACAELENLELMDPGKIAFGLGHCHTAEISLTTILSNFIFLADYQLVTLKKIEYEESRNSVAWYIKDLNILENNESKNLLRYLKFDNTPQLTYSVFFRNRNTSVNLFPFLIDYNALTNESDFQLLFYQCREGESGLRYFSSKSEKEKVIDYMATAAESMEIKSETQKNELQKNIRLDMVSKQFEEAMNTLLGTNFKFKPKVSEINDDLLGNL